MEAFNSRLDSFTKARRVKQSTTKRTLSLKWPHPLHFAASPDTLTEAGFFFNPSWDARDNVECFFCGKCLDGWEEQDDPFAIHWDKCRDSCAWAIVRCGLSEDVDRKGNFAFKDSSRQPDGKAMEKARLATFKANDSWPHDRVKGHGANSTKMAKAGFVFTPQTPGDDTGTCLYCRVALSGWDEDDDPLEEHHKRVKKSKLSCPFFPEAPAPKTRSRTTSTRSTARPKSRAGSRQPQPAPSENSASRSEDDSQLAPVPPRLAKRSRTISTTSTSKEKDASDALRRSTRSSRAKPPSEAEEDASCTEPRGSTIGHNRSKSLAKGKGKGPIEVIEEADEDDMPRPALPTKRVKGKENVAQDAKVPKPSRKTKTLHVNDTEEEAHQLKRRQPKRDQAMVDDQEESAPDVDSEIDVRPAAKRRNRVVQSTSSIEESGEGIKPTKVLAAEKMANGKTPIDKPEPADDRIDNTEGSSRPVKKMPSKVPAKPRTKPEAIEDSNDGVPDKQVEEIAKPSPLFERSKDKARSSPIALSETSEAAASPSNDEETIAPLPAPIEKSEGVVNGKSSKAVHVAPHHERSRSQTTSGASSSTSLPPNGKAKAASISSQNIQDDVMDIDSDVASTPATPPRGTTETTAKLISTLPSENESDGDVDSVVPARPTHTPHRPKPPTLRREKSPGTPPPASSSLLSMSSTTSMTRVEGHTDTETLVESLPLRTNGAQLTVEERMMTVEQWIRHEIEVQYERLRQDGETKIRLFKERAEEVRRQIEAL